MLTKILTPFSLPLVLEMPALKTCGGQRSLKPDASPSQQANSACNGDKPTASSYTLVTSAGPFSAAPGNLCSGPGWDPEDSSEQEQIHEELKHISPPLSSKAMVENNMWQWDPRAKLLSLHCSDTRTLAKPVLSPFQLWGLCQIWCARVNSSEEERF